MSSQLTYLTPAQTVRSRFTVQGSRFIATLAPVSDEQAAAGALADVRVEFPDATHHVYAYRIGLGAAMIERASDDREPAGSAGAPMLQVLQGKNISDALAIGTRYFGGTKLGIGGLTRAYRDCARLTLGEARLVKKEPMQTYRLEISYENVGTVNRLLQAQEAVIIEAQYTDRVVLVFTIPTRRSEALQKAVVAATRDQFSLNSL